MKIVPAFFHQVLKEMGHVVWPKRNDVFLTLILVVIVGAILSVLLFFMDSAVLFVLGKILGGTHG